MRSSTVGGTSAIVAEVKSHGQCDERREMCDERRDVGAGGACDADGADRLDDRIGTGAGTGTGVGAIAVESTTSIVVAATAANVTTGMAATDVATTVAVTTAAVADTVHVNTLNWARALGEPLAFLETSTATAIVAATAAFETPADL